jgi:apolipoprotein D and lipocalin family protein
MTLVYGGRNIPDRIPPMPARLIATARRALLLGALALSVAPAATASAEPAPLATVPSVDITRYAGLWYEIAAIPMWFQRNCLGDTTARYTPNPDGTIAVLNRCRTRDGTDEALGLARIVDTRSNARLEVSFFSILGWRPVWGDYWIIALAPDYSWSVVGGPKRRYGWILARTPALDAATLAAIRQRLAALGYDPARFIPTTQQPAPR